MNKRSETGKQRVTSVRSMGGGEGKNGGGVRTLFGSRFGTAAAFPVFRPGLEGLEIGRFHQRAKGVAADFSERGRERLRLAGKI